MHLRCPIHIPDNSLAMVGCISVYGDGEQEVTDSIESINASEGHRNIAQAVVNNIMTSTAMDWAPMDTILARDVVADIVRYVVGCCEMGER